MDLSKQLQISLGVIRGPTRHQYGGRGVKRKRDAMAAIMMSDQIATNLMVAYTFDGADKQSLAKEIAGALMAVPDALAYAYADKLTMISDPANDEIARLIAEAIQARWPVKYTPANPALHKSP